MPTVLITGGTSGIGEASTRAFADAGWHVVVTGRRQDRLDALAGERVHPLAFDIRDEAARDAALASLPEAFAGIDCLINNAGLALGMEPAHKASLSNWKTMIDTNVTALASITHKLLPGIVERRGSIINLSSVAATYPYPSGNVYGATKAFVHQLSLGLRSDLHGTGVRVTSVEPGFVETEFMLVRSGSQEAAERLYTGMKPITPDDVADTLLWIATLPPHVNVNVIEMMSVNQSWQPFAVHRDG